MKVTFPVDFWWGGATSGPQNEGRFHKPHVNVFDYHYDTKPEDFFRYVGPDVASDFYHLYESDIALFKDLGFNLTKHNTFDVYACGGIGPNPRIGIPVAHDVAPVSYTHLRA